VVKGARGIRIDRYGEGDKPRIEGDGLFPSAVYIYNTEYIDISNLDVSNFGPERAAGRTGILVQLKNFGVAHSIRLDHLDVHNVNGSLVKKEGGGAGIIFQNGGVDTPSRFDGLILENCTVRYCERNAILLNGNTRRPAWFPSTHVVIRKNLIEEVPGDGIVPIGCDSALIEYNVMRGSTRMLPDGESAAGIWPWSCDNTIIQYNEVSGHKAPWDGQGFDADWNCRNTTIQYNYSHDNEGGFLLICNDGSASTSWSAGTQGTIVRYNVSVNDGLRNTGKHAGFSPVIHITGPVVNTHIYNNIIYVPHRIGGLDSTLIEFGTWHGYADSTFVANNIFYVAGTGDFSLGKARNIFFHHNLYYGEQLGRPDDPEAVVGDPLFKRLPAMGEAGLGVMDYFKLRPGSPALRAGAKHAGAAKVGTAGAHTFALGDSAFLLDGKPFQMISGEMHYTRVPREAWRARMKMAKAMGLNTIGTYVFWNVHEPQKDRFDFSGNNDIAAYVRIAQEEGLWVVLRPSPYVCAEWEFGGYPYWLQKEDGLIVRSKEAQYLQEYKKYIAAVGRQLAPLQVNHGGNILMVQVENEYGSYGSDKEYLDINRQLFREAGFDGLLYTCDPAPDVEKGHLPGLLPAVNGLDKPVRVKALVRANHDNKGPYYVAEWYPAWFDWWGAKHHTLPAAKYASGLDGILSAGISINMYMFHGGTTRGFMNGANFSDSTPYEPQISSYDYDAPLDEAGNATEKFRQFRTVIQKHLPAGEILPDVPAAKPSIAIPAIRMTEVSSLFDRLPAPVTSPEPLTFEDLDQAYGYVLYRTVIPRGGAGLLKIGGLRDYGIVFIGGRRVGVLDRRLGQDSLFIEATGKDTVTMDILVENTGRINFGPYLLKNKKGITGMVTFGGLELKGWQMYSLPFDHEPSVEAAGEPVSTAAGVPVLRKGSFELSAPADTYFNMSGWGKGCVWINGHHLGRYWNIGPQQTLYVPAEWLRKGINEVVIFEQLRPERTELSAVDHAILDRSEKNGI
jgi:beta-galactosidase